MSYTNQHIPLPLWCSVHFSGLCGYRTTGVVCDQICWRWFATRRTMIWRASCRNLYACTPTTLLRWPWKSPPTWYRLLLPLSCVCPWPWGWSLALIIIIIQRQLVRCRNMAWVTTRAPCGWSLALRVVLSLEGGPWPCGWSLSLRVVLGLECLVPFCVWHKQQVTKIPYCTGVMMSAGSGSIYRHMVTALLTYHLSSVTNSHLILGYLLGLMWVRGLGTPSPWPCIPSPCNHHCYCFSFIYRRKRNCVFSHVCSWVCLSVNRTTLSKEPIPASVILLLLCHYVVLIVHCWSCFM